jgi:hypothetical protein
MDLPAGWEPFQPQFHDLVAELGEMFKALDADRWVLSAAALRRAVDACIDKIQGTGALLEEAQDEADLALAFGEGA